MRLPFQSGIVLLLLGLSAPALAQEEPALKDADIKKLTRPLGQWVEAESAADTEKSLEAREALDEAAAGIQRRLKDTDVLRCVGSWEEVLESGRDYSTKFRRGRVDVQNMGSESEPESVVVAIPKSYNPRKESAPMLLLLPDGAAEPEEAVESLPKELLDSFVVVAPDLRDMDPADAFRSTGRLRVLGAFGFASRNLRIDRNRIYLVGAGTHALTAVRYAAVLPHFFAGVSVVGGDADPGPSAANLKLFAFSKQQDLAAAAAWILEQDPRDPYPASFEYVLTQPWSGRAFWVQALRFDPAEDDTAADDLSRLKVEVDRDSNTIRLSGHGVYQVTLYLNDRIVDLDRPIRIVRNGVDYEYQATRSLGTLLENFKMNLDARAVFPAMVRQVDLPQE